MCWKRNQFALNTQDQSYNFRIQLNRCITVLNIFFFRETQTIMDTVLEKNDFVQITFRDETFKKIDTTFMHCNDVGVSCKSFDLPSNARKVQVCYTNEKDYCGYCDKDPDHKFRFDDDVDMECKLSFTDLSNAILSMFEKNGHHFNFAEILGGTVAMMDIHEYDFTSFIGNIEDFHDWLKPKLDQFFKGFYSRYFCTLNPRKNRRRQFIYQTVVKSKSCKKITFKRKMMNELNLDRISFLNEGKYDGDFTDTEENRRILFLNCIINYVYRLFLINQCCVP